MNRDEFMRQLARLLSDLPDNERMEAIRYYNDYFDEAGPENESKVIQELGSPGKVAAIIKADLKEASGQEVQNAVSAELSYEDVNGSSDSESQQDGGQTNGRSQQSNGWAEGQNQQDDGRTNGQSQQNNGWTENREWNSASGWRTGYGENAAPRSPVMRKRKSRNWALIIILLVFASPFLVGIGSGIFGFLVGVLSLFFGVWIALLAGGAGLAIGGVGVFIKGVIRLVSAPATGLAGMGLGLIFTGIGLLFLVLFIGFTFKVLPRFCRASVNFVSRLLHRRKGAAVNE